MPERPPRFYIQKELQTLKLLLPEVILFLFMLSVLAVRILVALLY
ncbi:hypothetical protein [Caldicellulosiruptor naganoensis]|uniref:Uncharacterized protein n=1 Tax=Caldicellulosiruptor naganoensis TaxID=29324 RepID=A0ABY7BFR7_9FIRM|nr:hypothetical protein [Caldicellulosiruptor naganoensis]WAM31658.1 hypothetical protein OTJ99_000089 [Caldicellulosiruptor naganoensis]